MVDMQDVRAETLHSIQVIECEYGYTLGAHLFSNVTGCEGEGSRLMVAFTQRKGKFLHVQFRTLPVHELVVGQ
jgi:hypothetical protein